MKMKQLKITVHAAGFLDVWRRNLVRYVKADGEYTRSLGGRSSKQSKIVLECQTPSEK